MRTLVCFGFLVLTGTAQAQQTYTVGVQASKGFPQGDFAETISVEEISIDVAERGSVLLFELGGDVGGVGTVFGEYAAMSFTADFQDTITLVRTPVSLTIKDTWEIHYFGIGTRRFLKPTNDGFFLLGSIGMAQATNKSVWDWDEGLFLGRTKSGFKIKGKWGIGWRAGVGMSLPLGKRVALLPNIAYFSHHWNPAEGGEGRKTSFIQLSVLGTVEFVSRSSPVAATEQPGNPR